MANERSNIYLIGETIQPKEESVEQALKKIGEMARQEMIPLAALQALIDEYDPWVQVNRAVMPEYPDWVKELLYPELENTGPAKFDISTLERWLHPKQVKGVAEGNEIHDCLKNKNLLADCLGYADLLAIRSRGVVFYRKHFSGKAVFGWKSAVRDHAGGLSVPCLIESDVRVGVDWGWLGSGWDSRSPALRFASQPSGIES